MKDKIIGQLVMSDLFGCMALLASVLILKIFNVVLVFPLSEIVGICVLAATIVISFVVMRIRSSKDIEVENVRTMA